MAATAVKTRYFVGNFPYTTTQEQLITYFSCFGTVTQADIILHKETGKSRGFGYVTIEGPGDQQIDHFLTVDGRQPSEQLKMGPRAINLQIAKPRD